MLVFNSAKYLSSMVYQRNYRIAYKTIVFVSKPNSSDTIVTCKVNLWIIFVGYVVVGYN